MVSHPETDRKIANREFEIGKLLTFYKLLAFQFKQFSDRCLLFFFSDAHSLTIVQQLEFTEVQDIRREKLTKGRFRKGFRLGVASCLRFWGGDILGNWERIRAFCQTMLLHHTWTRFDWSILSPSKVVVYTVIFTSFFSFCYSISTAGITYGLSSRWEMEIGSICAALMPTIPRTG